MLLIFTVEKVEISIYGWNLSKLFTKIRKYVIQLYSDDILERILEINDFLNYCTKHDGNQTDPEANYRKRIY